MPWLARRWPGRATDLQKRRRPSASEFDRNAGMEAVSPACEECRKAERPLGRTELTELAEPPAPVLPAPLAPVVKDGKAVATNQSYVRQVVELVRQIAEAAH